MICRNCAAHPVDFDSSTSVASDSGSRSILECSWRSPTGLVRSVLSSDLICRTSSKTADSETDRCKRRKVHRTRVGDLQEQRLAGLFETRPLEYHNAIRSLSGDQTPCLQSK